ncbi:MAG: amino acid ABC transporter permease [Sulfurospirillaceae bacterium]|nr:amino acid ABC transporter permease [Sulfurospirillaceae bacterium]
MDIDLMLKVYPYFLKATVVTIELSVSTILLGLICGAFGAFAKLSTKRYFRIIGNVYVSVIRGTPALLQLFIIYFGGPQVGIQLNALEAGIIGLGINIGAYMTETIRGAIISIDKGQIEAARTLGLNKTQTMMKVVLPQAARLMIRPLGVNINAQIKATALVSTISVVELTYTAQRFIGSTYKPFEMFLLAGVIYIILISAVGKLIDFLDRKVQIQ